MNNRRVFIFALLTKLTVSPQFFFFNSDGKICSWIFRPETPIVWTTIRFLMWFFIIGDR